MRKLMSMLGLVAAAMMANAQIVRVGTYESDAFIYGVDGSTDTGYVNVQWSGYATPNYGVVGWRVVVWDATVPQAPIASETYHASANEGVYARTFAVTPYHPIRVELYAVGDQYANSANLSNTVTTSMWVKPIGTSVGTSYAYPTNTVYDTSYQNTPVVTPGYPVNYVPAPVYQTYYYPLVDTIALYRNNTWQ